MLSIFDLGENVVFSTLQCSVYLPPCVALEERGNTNRRREMNLVASSMLLYLATMNANTKVVVHRIPQILSALLNVWGESVNNDYDNYE